MEKSFFIKGFDKDLKCRDYQFKVGKKYKIKLPKGYKLTKNDLCTDKVFHFCDSLEKVHKYYRCDDANNRFCEIEVLGQICNDEDKCGSDYIKIVREIKGEEFLALKGFVNGNSGLFNSGSYNSGYYNSGNYNSGSHNTGYHNCGNYNSGYRNCGNYNSGNHNSGNCNSGNHNNGYYNSGYCNSGSHNSGDYNSGYYNSGNYNSGYYNYGYCNSGFFNKADNSNGVFCTVEPKIYIFNQPTDMTLSEFKKSKYYQAIISSEFPLAVYNEATNRLTVNTYADACRKWWAGMSDDNKQIIKDIPNFDVDIFCDITGIDKNDV